MTKASIILSMSQPVTDKKRKRTLAENEEELAACKREIKRIKREIECNPETLRQRLPTSISRLLVDTGRLSQYTVSMAQEISSTEVKHSGGAHYIMHELSCSITLDGQGTVFSATKWDRDWDCDWKAGSFWVPSNADPFDPDYGEGWEFLLQKNGRDEKKALASLAVVSCEGSVFTYPKEATHLGKAFLVVEDIEEYSE